VPIQFHIGEDVNHSFLTGNASVLDRRNRARQVGCMGARRPTLAVAVTVAFFAGTCVSFFTLPLWVAFIVNLAKQGARADWLGFSGAVFAAFMTLTAAIIAWFAVQQQIAAPEESRRHSQAEAKYVGVVALAQLVHAASTLLYAVQIARAANTLTATAEWDGVVDRTCTQVSTMLDHFALREIASEMPVDDRIHFLIVVLQLSTMMSIHRTPLGILNREQALLTLEHQLRRLQPYITGFDPDLWHVFERDSSLPGS
jgi:hypothetical protein